MDKNFPEDLLSQIVRVSHEVPLSTLAALCNELRQVKEDCAPDNVLSLTASITSSGLRDSFRLLLKTWERFSDIVNPRELAWALRSASEVRSAGQNLPGGEVHR